MWTIACSTDPFPLEFSFSALVLKESTNEQIVSQAMELTGVSYLLQARAMPFFSRRSEYLVKKLLALLSEHSIAILSLDSSPHTAREVQHRSYSRRVR